MSNFIDYAFAAVGGLLIWHHLLHPPVLRFFAHFANGPEPTGTTGDGPPPRVTVVVPAYQEERHIARKIRNLAALDYPRDRFSAVVLLDGCTDRSEEFARAALAELGPAAEGIELRAFAENRGKVAVLNEAIAAVADGIVVLTDASAEVEPDALRRVVAHFSRPAVGVVSGAYGFAYEPSPGEKMYWIYQTRVKAAEAALGAPMGAHGAFYAIRREAWKPLPADTINDDFVMPMSIVADGYRGVYDQEIKTFEREPSRPSDDLRRRMRIAAGNLQQTVRLARLLDPRRPGIAFAFLSGKGLRAFVPMLVAAAMLLTAAGAILQDPFYVALLVTGSCALLSGPLARVMGPDAPRLLRATSYVIEGHASGVMGTFAWLRGPGAVRWGRDTEDLDDYVHPGVRFCKRILDVVIALIALAVLLVLIIPLAIVIKLDSRGPIFYRQIRVGERTARSSRLFHLYKLRTMRIDAEVKSGPVWATSNDPRVTRVGRFLRKSRLDELPQCINVLRGEMSVVGPRPERPLFVGRLEDDIPFYVERTYGLRPGITGLAQVSQGYDESIEDVRSKVLHDHAYAMLIQTPGSWLKTDLGIILRTFTVMVLGKGQ